jgi:hypothetical protein
VMKDSRTAVLFMVIFIFSYRGLLRWNLCNNIYIYHIFKLKFHE